MKLPNAEFARVEREKILEYLLSRAQPTGGDKAAFFDRFGFAASRWDEFAGVLRAHAIQHEVTKVKDTPFGTRYTV